MWVHYDTKSAALDHLRSNGWGQTENGAWVSKDGIVKATIHPVNGTEKVAICYTEIV